MKQERNTCMNKNKNKRPMGLNGHTSSRDSMLTSLQKDLYLNHIINIIHNFNHPPRGHEIYNFGVHSLTYIITTYFVCNIYVKEFKRRIQTK